MSLIFAEIKIPIVDLIMNNLYQLPITHIKFVATQLINLNTVHTFKPIVTLHLVLH